jgi:hypothetical protein
MTRRISSSDALFFSVKPVGEVICSHFLSKEVGSKGV